MDKGEGAGHKGAMMLKELTKFELLQVAFAGGPRLDHPGRVSMPWSPPRDLPVTHPNPPHCRGIRNPPEHKYGKISHPNVIRKLAKQYKELDRRDYRIVSGLRKQIKRRGIKVVFYSDRTTASGLRLRCC